MARFCRVGLDLLAEVLDVHINDPAPGIKLGVAPEALPDLFPGHQVVAILHQTGENLEFLGGQGNDRAPDLYDLIAQIDGKVSGGKDAGLLWVAPPGGVWPVSGLEVRGFQRA